MTLSEFIRQSASEIIDFSVDFARTLPPLASSRIDIGVLRNHLPLILTAIATDLERFQSRAEGIAKAEGRVPAEISETAAQTHGRIRAEGGLSVMQVVAEYRVLRATVSRLWSDTTTVFDVAAIADLVRFNEAIDQAIAESVAFHTKEVERWRNMLLAIVGHDLRDPLSTLTVTAQLLEAEAGHGPLAPHIRVLSRGTQRLRVLLDSLLEYSNAGLDSPMVLHRTSVDLDRVCREEIDLLRSAYPVAEIRLSTSGDLAGSCDESRVREALTNLVANAVQYRVPGTPIEVVVRGESRRIVIVVRNRVAQSIDQEVLDTLFEPLRRRESAQGRSRRNLGLGLFIVKEIAKAHDGDVAAQSVDGHVVFTLTLPRAPTAKSGAANETL